MDFFASEALDPAVIIQVADESAAALVSAGRATDDPQLTARLVELVDEIGLSTVAQLWADRPARSLAGALWRLYALREWVRRDPAGASTDYAQGLRFADVAGVIAGAASPPGPQELRDLADAILTGVFDGDVAVALERAAAFCRVIAAGRGARDPAPALGQAREAATVGDLTWPDDVRRGVAMLGTADDLQAVARLWREGQLR